MKKHDILFKLLKCPYRKVDNENMSVIYECYKQDSNNIIKLGEHTFYKIIECYEIHTKSSNLLVVLDNQMQLRIGNTVIDENDKPYLTVLAPPEAQASFKISMNKLKKSIETGILYD